MKTYYIYNISNDEYLGEVKANSIVDAEYKACGVFLDVESDYISAFTTKY